MVFGTTELKFYEKDVKHYAREYFFPDSLISSWILITDRG